MKSDFSKVSEHNKKIILRGTNKIEFEMKIIFLFLLLSLYGSSTSKHFHCQIWSFFSKTSQLNPSYLLLQNQNFFCTVVCFSLAWAHTPTHNGYCEGRLILHNCTPTMAMIWQLFLYLSSIRLLSQLPLRSKYKPSIHTSPHTLLYRITAHVDTRLLPCFGPKVLEK